ELPPLSVSHRSPSAKPGCRSACEGVAIKPPRAEGSLAQLGLAENCVEVQLSSRIEVDRRSRGAFSRTAISVLIQLIPSYQRLGGGCAASSVCSSCGVSVNESATAFSFTCCTELDSAIAMTFPLRMVQASATAAAEEPCASPIRASVGSRSKLAPGPPSGE